MKKTDSNTINLIVFTKDNKSLTLSLHSVLSAPEHPNILFNKHYQLNIKCYTDTLLNLQDLLAAKATISIPTNHGESFMHGIITAITHSRHNHLNQYDIEFSSPLEILTNKAETTIHKATTIKDLLTKLLHNKFTMPYKTKLNINDRELINHSEIQHEETDLQFLQRMAQKYKLLFFFKYNDHSAELVIADKENFIESKHGQQYNLLLAPKNQCEINSTTQIYLFQLKEEIKLANNNQQQKTLIATTELSPIQIGDIVKLKTKSNDKKYIVVGINYHIESYHSHFMLTANKPSVHYHQTLTLMPREQINYLDIEPDLFLSHNCYQASTVGPNQSSTAHLDKFGRYYLSFDDTNTTSQDGKYFNAPLTQHAAGANSGINFPLLPNTPVLLAAIDNDITNSSILGVLSETGLAPANQLLTPGMHGLQFGGSSEPESIKLFSRNSNAHNNKNEFELSPRLKSRMQTLYNINYSAGKFICLKINKSHDLNIKKNYHLVVKSCFKFIAEKSVCWQAKQIKISASELSLSAENSTINCKKLSIQSKLKSQIISQAGDVTLQSKQTTRLSSSNDIYIQANKNKISLGNSLAQISLDKSGNVNIIANQIVIQAEQQQFLGKKILGSA